jgi:hypothetical protein
MIFDCKWTQPVIGLGTAAVLLVIGWAVYGGNVTNKAVQPVASKGASHLLCCRASAVVDRVIGCEVRQMESRQAEPGLK